MAAFDQGPHENINYYLLTTGFNIDPRHGGMAESYYQHLKNVIQTRSEIVFEHEPVRQITDINPQSFLMAYPSQSRTIYQWLFGLAQHSDSWNCDTLTTAINDSIFSRNTLPEHGEFSLEFDNSWKNGFTLYKNASTGSTNIWLEHINFFYSSRLPVRLDGNDGDVWLANKKGELELWYLQAFQWYRLHEYVQNSSPTGQIIYDKDTPPNQLNSWWVNLDGLVIRRYDKHNNQWSDPLVVHLDDTGPCNEGDVKIVIKQGVWKIYQRQGNVWKLGKFSKYEAQDRDTNTMFNGIIGQNNFVIECDQTKVFQGSPVEETYDLRIKKDGVLIETMVDCIDFVGSDLQVTSAGSGSVRVEHPPVTTLSAQNQDPTSALSTGKIFTKNIGSTTELFYLDDNGTVIQITNDGSLTQNIKLIYVTLDASAGQTTFTVPNTAKDILTVKINGVDTHAWTYNYPQVSYDASLGGYEIQQGDKIAFLYYE